MYPNVWDLIGGHCEEGEEPEQALCRELVEELNVVPTRFYPMECLDEPNSAQYGEYRYHTYLVLGWEGTPCNMQPEEHSEIRWFSLAEAEQLHFPHPKYLHLFKQISTRANVCRP
jgi:8-oxo-dGTP pyrophosphatase MutT (NUDIX family)